jgi:hypothetical protein
VVDRVAQLGGPMTALREAAGVGVVADNLVNGLTAVFSPLAVAIVALVVTRDGLRARLHEAGAAHPLVTAREGGLPDAGALRKLVVGVMHGAA